MNKVTFTIGEQTIEFPVSSIKIDGNKFEVIVDKVKNPPVKPKPANDKIWTITRVKHTCISTTKDTLDYYTSEEKAKEILKEYFNEWVKTARVEWKSSYQINVHPNYCNDVLVYRVDYARVN